MSSCRRREMHCASLRAMREEGRFSRKPLVLQTVISIMTSLRIREFTYDEIDDASTERDLPFYVKRKSLCGRLRR
jgi:hypothetical protein